MRILVTGADGFVGRHAVARFGALGHDVTAVVKRGARPVDAPRCCEMDLADGASVAALAHPDVDGVLHLAAVASGGDARRDPGAAWDVNAAGTARVCEVFGQLRAEGRSDPLVLVVSTAEVYGQGQARPRTERDDPAPCSPYAASKLGAEIAAQEVARRTGLRVVIVRAFPHSGAGHDTRFVLPAFARRLIAAKAAGGGTVAVGNLDPIRDFLHVSDVVDAYLALLTDGEPGEVYNVASGEGHSIRELLAKLAHVVGVTVEPLEDPDMVRPAEIAHLVGDAEKLRTRTGWEPHETIDAMLAEVVRAQAN